LELASKQNIKDTLKCVLGFGEGVVENLPIFMLS